MPVFVRRCVDLRPGGHARRVDGRRVHALRHALDEIELPGAAFDLPGAQCDEAGEQQQRHDAQRDPQRHGARAALRCRVVALRTAQGMFFMSWIIGIMLWLRWYITHNEPASVITTSTSVKIRASIDQPPSTLVFMCRK